MELSQKNYYRNVTVKEFLNESSKLDFKYHITYNPFSRDLYFFGKKGIKTSNKKNKEIKKVLNLLLLDMKEKNDEKFYLNFHYLS